MKKLFLAVLLLLVMVGLPALYIRVNGFDLSPAVLERAVLARELSRGGGYVAPVVRPAFFASGRDFARQPALYQPPLYPVLLSLLFRMVSDSDRAVAAFSLLSFWLAGLVLVLAVRKLFDPSSAFLCGLFYFSNALLLEEMVSGSPLFLEVLLLVLVAVLAVRPLLGPRSYLLLGLLLGLGCLSSPPWLGVAALVLLYRLRVELSGAAGRPSRKKAALAAVVNLGVGLAVVNLPWWLFRWLGRGDSPLYFYPALRSFTPASPGPFWWLELVRLASFPSLRELLAKWRDASRLVYENWVLFSGVYLAPFFWLSLLWRFKDPRRSRLRFFVFACLLVFALEFLLGGRRSQNLLLFVPWALALGAVVFNRLRLLVPRPLFSRVVLAVFVLVNLFPFLIGLRSPAALSPPVSRQLMALRPALPERAVLVSDVPSEAAWYAGCPAVWLPAEAGYLSSLAADPSWRYYLFLTPEALNYPSPRGRPSWPEVYRGGGYSPFWRILGVEEFAGGRLLVEIAFD